MRQIEIKMAYSLIKCKRDTANLALLQLQESRGSRKLIHDLKTPITALMLNTELADNLNSEHIELALRSSRQIYKLLNEKKDATEEMGFCINNELEYCASLARRAGGKVEISYMSNTKESDRLQGSKTQFRRILTNILNNSLEAQKEQKVIKITMSQTPRKYTVEVQDYGKGILKKDLCKIFNENFSTKTNNSGLGLTITKEIIQKDFSGEIQIESEPLKGTKVTLILPKTPTLAV